MIFKHKTLFLILSIICINLSTSKLVASSNHFDETVEIKLTGGKSLHEIDKRFASLYQNVSGPEDDYLKCSICMFGFWKNTRKTVSIVASTGAAVLTTLVFIPDLLDEKTKTVLSSAAAITNLIAIYSLAFEKYSAEARETRKDQLKTLLEEHGVRLDTLEDESTV